MFRVEGAMLEFTDQQSRILESSSVTPARIVNPQTHETFVLVRLEEYQRLVANDYDASPWTADEMHAAAWEAGASIGWEDMDGYDKLPEKS